MKKPKVYIDGKDGTTGLEIYERLAERRDVELLLIDEKKRKDMWERKRMFDAADLVFLCLPDDAAREVVALAEKPSVKVIDCSTAHRTDPDWVYGFPELSKSQRGKIKESKRVANPGCHATGFIAGVYPLVEMGALSPDAPLTCVSLTGYSGGGKKLIAEYRDPDRDPRHESHRIYGLELRHKHLPEMQTVCGLTRPPLFSPILGDFYRGMATTVYLHNQYLRSVKNAKGVWELLTAFYRGQPTVTVAPLGGEEPFIYASTMAEKDSLSLIVCGNEEQTTVTALFDNLGKGASGAAVQNMNLMLGLEETAGLNL